MNYRDCSIAILGFALIFASFSSYAVQSVNVQTYNPSTSTKFVILEDGLKTEWPKLTKYSFGVNYNYVQDPLVATDLARVGQVSSIINSISTVDAFIGYKPDKQLGLYVGMPIHNVTYAPGNPLALANPGYATGSNTVAGDLKLMAKVRLNQDDGNTDITVIPEFHLPTGNTENFVSDASTYIALRFALERVFEKFTLGVNSGFGLAQNATYETINMQKRILFGVGGFIPFSDTIGGSIEFHAQIPVPFNTYLNPNEIYGGLRYAATESFALTAGGSIGKMSGSTGQNFRAIAGLRYTIPDSNSPDTQKPVYIPPPAPPAPVTPIPAATPALYVAPVNPTPIPTQRSAQPIPVPTAAPIHSAPQAPAIPTAADAKSISALPYGVQSKVQNKAVKKVKKKIKKNR